MLTKDAQWYPVVDASFDHGRTFTQTAELVPPDPKNWGDRPFVAVGPEGNVYVTWDYGPDRSTVTSICDPREAAAFRPVSSTSSCRSRSTTRVLAHARLA
jgi:hypothetical protein